MNYDEWHIGYTEAGIKALWHSFEYCRSMFNWRVLETGCNNSGCQKKPPQAILDIAMLAGCNLTGSDMPPATRASRKRGYG